MDARDTGLARDQLQELQQSFARGRGGIDVVPVGPYPALRRPAEGDRRAVEAHVVRDLSGPKDCRIEVDIEAVHEHERLPTERSCLAQSLPKAADEAAAVEHVDLGQREVALRVLVAYGHLDDDEIVLGPWNRADLALDRNGHDRPAEGEPLAGVAAEHGELPVVLDAIFLALARGAVMDFQLAVAPAQVRSRPSRSAHCRRWGRIVRGR